MFNYNLFLKRLSKRKIYTESFIKKEIAKRLLKRLDFIKLKPATILVDGYSDNDYLDILKKRFAKVDIHTQQDIKSYDIIISNSIIHLTDSLADKLDYYYKLLNDKGVLLFSTFGDKSFSSLKKAFKRVDNLKHTNDMIGLLTWGNTLQASRYKTPVVESDLVTFTYDSSDMLFKDIRSLNEPLADTNMHTGLTAKNLWHDFVKNFSKNLQLEIEIIYGYAICKASDRAAPRTDSNRVSLNELKKQIVNFKKSSSVK